MHVYQNVFGILNGAEYVENEKKLSAQRRKHAWPVVRDKVRADARLPVRMFDFVVERSPPPGVDVPKTRSSGRCFRRTIYRSGPLIAQYVQRRRFAQFQPDSIRRRYFYFLLNTFGLSKRLEFSKSFTNSLTKPRSRQVHQTFETNERTPYIRSL